VGKYKASNLLLAPTLVDEIGLPVVLLNMRNSRELRVCLQPPDVKKF